MSFIYISNSTALDTIVSVRSGASLVNFDRGHCEKQFLDLKKK